MVRWFSTFTLLVVGMLALMDFLGDIVDDDGLLRHRCYLDELDRVLCQDDVGVVEIDGFLRRATFQGLPLVEAERVGSVVDEHGFRHRRCVLDEEGLVACEVGR